MFQQIAVSILIKALCHILGICRGFEDCPDGVCDELVDDLQSINRKVESPKLKAAVGGPLDYLRCVDVKRLLAAIRELVDVFKDAKMCIDGDDSNVITLGAAPDPEA